MQVDVELMDANFFFKEETWYTNKESKMQTKKPLLNVIWIDDEGAMAQISTIDMIFDPIQEYVTIPEEVRLAVIEKYGSDLKQYYQEDNK